MKKERTLQQKKELKTSIIFVLVVLCLVLGLFALSKYRWDSRFIYEKALDEVLFSYEDKTVKLREAGYYILIEEEAVNEHALAYDSENPLAYWNLHVSEGYVSDEAKDAALNYCIRDVLYGECARADGIELTAAEEEEVHDKAEGIVNNLTEKQASIGLTEEDIYKALYNNRLADKWVVELAEEEGITISEEVLSAYYGMNSYFFKDMLEEKEVKINEELWGELSFGRITIN